MYIRRPLVGVFRPSFRGRVYLTPLPVDLFADLPTQNPGGQSSNHEAQPPFRPSPAKTTYPIRVSQRVTLGSFGDRFVRVRSFGAKPRGQARIGSVLMVLRKSHEDGATFPAHALQIGSVLVVSSIVLAVLRKTYGTGRPCTAN